ncbi:hypothetical protein M6B38_378110 [Iris pallida]|uniref:Uncharacterized protein n=1 Tax=Iris pallida TaxID=29817 RepID=A0AAX6G962_IRIPA|nr:hypothetical protein M6B38_378110 [Iris pallida]
MLEGSSPPVTRGVASSTQTDPASRRPDLTPGSETSRWCSVSRGPLETRRAGTEFEEVVVGSGLRRLLGGTGCGDPGQ